MNTFFLLDNDIDDYSFLKKQFENIVRSPSRKKKLFSWIEGCFDVLQKSKKNDLIICWFDFQAVILFWMSLIFFQKRNIICLNLLLKDKTTKKNKVVSFFYKVALSSKNFQATVTSLEYGQLLNNKFKKEFDYILLHDVYHSYYERSYPINDKTVFCGGRNGRDWEMFFEIAKRMPETIFKAVLPFEKRQKHEKQIPPNVKIFENIPYEDFFKEMCSSEIVIMPLDTNAPAGLIVLFQAAANEKTIIISNTPVTREYISNNRGFLVEKNIDDWVKTIKFCQEHEMTAKMYAHNLKSFLKDQCNENNFLKTIKGIHVKQ